MRNPLPYMQVYVNDLFALTIAWEGEERSLYLTLLSYQWAAGSLPADVTKLAKLIGWERKNLQRYWPRVSSEFEEHDGQLQNAMLEEMRAEFLKQSATLSKNGAIGAAKRWGKDSPANGQAIAPPLAKPSNGHKPNDSPANGNPNGILGQARPREEDTHSAGARAGEQSAKSLAEDAEAHVGFERIRKAYPPRAGRQNWIVAEHNARLLVGQGSSWNDLLEGVKRYAKYIDSGGVSSTAHILAPETFFIAADKPWAQPWPAPIAKPRAVPKHEPFVAPDDPEEAVRAQRN